MFLTLSNVDVAGKNVLLRTGFDVDVVNGQIVNDKRLKDGLPTIVYLLEHNVNKITIINHVGRPQGKFDSNLSNKPIENYLRANVSDAAKIQVLENIRFDKREEEGNDELAKQLAQGQDLFIQDAFSNCHRNHSSMVNITKFLSSYAGLLVEKEYSNLSRLIENPVKPFIVIIGGIKVETKVPVIENIKPLVDFVLIGGATANEAKAQHLFQNDDKVILPIDGVKDETGNIRDVGPQTIELFRQKLESAKTVFWNGNLGMTEDARFRVGSRQIGTILAGLDAYVIAGGGDTDELIGELEIEDKFDYISTAGGASLVFLSGQKMPGLQPLIH